MGKCISSFIDQFLLKFDYSTKVKFIIWLAILSTLPLLYLQYTSQNIFLKPIRQQKMGLDYQLKFSQLMNALLQYNLIDKAKLNPDELYALENKINELFTYLNQGSKKLISINPTMSEQLILNIHTIQQNWDKLKKWLDLNSSDEKLLQLNFYENLSLMEETIRETFDFNNNFDSGTAYLIQINSINFPNINLSLARMILAVKNLTENNLLKSDFLLQSQIFLDYNKTILNQIEKSQSVNLLIRKKIAETNLMNKWQDYHEAINDLNAFLKPIKEQKAPKPFLTQLSQKGFSIIEKSFAIQETLIAILSSVLDAQISTLQTRQILGAVFILLGIAIVLIVYMTRVILRPLVDLKDAVEKLTAGDLSVRVKITSKDEVAEMSKAFNSMVEFFDEVMQKTKKIASNLSESSSNISQTSKELEKSLDFQKNCINQIGNNVKGISKTVQDFASSLIEINTATHLTTHLANVGRESLVALEAIMQKMANASTHIVTTLETFQEKIKNIHMVISTLVRLADQINLLSLNTAIRAKKKNSKHLGFSVIAEKIRELADLTASVTLDMENIVQEIVSMVMESAEKVNNFSKRITEQVQDAADIQKSLKMVVSHTQLQVETFETVNKGMQEQTSRSIQIEESIRQLKEGAQKTAQSVRNLCMEIEFLYHSTNHFQDTAQIQIPLTQKE